MSQLSAERINPYRMARDGASRQGEIPLSRMTRLAPLLSDDQGTARFEFAFHLDSGSRPVIEGSVQAALGLVCQRCLKAMTLALDLKIELVIVRSDEEAAAVSKQREPLTLSSDSVSLADLVEDELILGLPAAPLHPAGSCRPPAQKTAR